MSFLEQLREQKQAGERELYQREAEEREREAQEAARISAEQKRKRTAEEERDLKMADAVFETLPDLVKKAASQGLATAVLSDSLVEEDRQEGKQSRAIVANKRQYYLHGWQVPFYEKCKEAGVPLTVISERVDSGIGRILLRQYHFLAVDLERI